MQGSTADTTIPQRLDSLSVTLLHGLAVGLCALGFTFDLLEVALGSALSAVFSAPGSAGPGQLPLLLASMYVGAAIGAPLLGWLADRHGRRVTLMGVLALMAIASLAGAFSGSITQLTVWRCVGGLALGGYPPLMVAYLTDLAPAGRRGLMVLAAVAVGTLGPAAGIFLVRWLDATQPFGLEGWRWGFIAGGVGAAVVALLFRALPESPRWLQGKGRLADAEAACRRLENSRPMLAYKAPAAAPETDSAMLPMTVQRRWTLVAALFFLSPWSTVAFPLLTGAILAQKGFKLSDTLLYVGLSAFGPLVGTLLAALGIDRIERRAALAGCAGAMVVFGLVFVQSSTPLWLVCSSFGFTLFVSLFVTVLNLYGAELFPTGERAMAIAGAWAFNRVGAALAPLLLLPLLGRVGPLAMFSVIGASLLASMALLAIAPQGRQLRAV